MKIIKLFLETGESLPYKYGKYADDLTTIHDDGTVTLPLERNQTVRVKQGEGFCGIPQGSFACGIMEERFWIPKLVEISG